MLVGWLKKLITTIYQHTNTHTQYATHKLMKLVATAKHNIEPTRIEAHALWSTDFSSMLFIK